MNFDCKDTKFLSNLQIFLLENFKNHYESYLNLLKQLTIS